MGRTCKWWHQGGIALSWRPSLWGANGLGRWRWLVRELEVRVVVKKGEMGAAAISLLKSSRRGTSPHCLHRRGILPLYWRRILAPSCSPQSPNHSIPMMHVVNVCNFPFTRWCWYRFSTSSPSTHVSPEKKTLLRASLSTWSDATPATVALGTA
jgi:hypothetical protein